LELWDSEREELLPLITEQMIAASPFPMDVEVKQWGTDWSNLLDVTF